MQRDSAVLQAFEDTYKREFGFVLEQRSIIVDDLRVRATGKVSWLVQYSCICSSCYVYVVYICM